MTITNIILLVFALPTAWWASKFDPQVTGENRRKDILRRLARCLATAILLGIFFGPDPVRAGYGFVPLIMIIPISVALLWRSCLASLFARGFHRLIDSDDGREFDPAKSDRNLDEVAGLLRHGRHEEAVKRVEELKRSGEA
ncbi:MAG TPA: hypothetical protein VFY06_05310, partial [Verrucomicrobiae bacterium]|nr:hypothetical protein [Verrucomicrobiae bacterium]